MKNILITYAVLFLLSMLGMATLGWLFGAGYIYIFFAGWQLQTSLWILLFLLLSFSFLLQLGWIYARKYAVRKKREQDSIFTFNALHPYEKLAVLWLLDATQEKNTFVEQIFQQSGLLNAVIKAQFLKQGGAYTQALDALNEIPEHAFELAQLQRIDIYLLQHQATEALSALSLLSHHQLPMWLDDVKEGYYAYLNSLWQKFSILFPWDYLQANKHAHLKEFDKVPWLTALLTQFDQANFEDIETLKQHYQQTYHYKLMNEGGFEEKVLWLKVIARFVDLEIQKEELIQSILSEKFDQDVFYLWFEQKMLTAQPNYEEIEKQVNYWENKYTQLPILAFVKWHIYQATQRLNEADILLTQYPEHILMIYLRLKVKLKDDEELIQQLNILFESDTNFLKLNI